MVRVKKAQKQSTALLERNEPQQLVPDEQLFFVDVRGHESKSILKLKKGHVPGMQDLFFVRMIVYMGFF